MEYVDASGDVIPRDQLTIPKAQELARFLSLAVDRSTKLLETRRNGYFEILVVTLSDLEIGQQPIYPLLDEERFALCFSTDDDFAPQVLALRKDFPNAPHINRTYEEIPRSLCIYDGPYDEVKLTWTAGRFIERIRIWIRDTACGSLHRDDQPLEPIILASAYTLILPADLFSAAEDERPDELMILGLSETTAGTVLSAKRVGQMSADERRLATSIVCTLFACKPQVHGLIQHVPKNLRELNALHMNAGRDLADDLRARLQAWNRPDAPLGAPLLIVSIFPRQRRAGEEPEASDICAFICPAVRDVGVAVGAWQKVGNTVGAILDGESDEGLLRAVSIDILNPSFDLSRTRAAAANGERAEALKITAVGAGALGSQVVTTLARGGFGAWTLIDNDILMPHNCARHELNSLFVGFPKAEVLAAHCNRILGSTKVADHLIANVVRPETAAAAVAQALNEAAVVADFSASVAVARELAVKGGTARRLSAFLSPSGNDLVLLVEDKARSLRLDHLEMQYYRSVLRNAALANHMRPPLDRVRYAQSCRDVSSAVPADLVSMHAAIAARGTRRCLGSDDASISVWTASDDREVTQIAVAPEPVSEVTIGGWRVCWDCEVERIVDAARGERLPSETGGVLVGAVDPQRHIIYVVDALLSPPDSIEWPHSYIRGSEGLEEQVAAMSTRTAGMLQYVGEWHSHPDGCSVQASGTDQQALRMLMQQMAFDGLPALMWIVGQRERRWFVASI